MSAFSLLFEALCAEEYLGLLLKKLDRKKERCVCALLIYTTDIYIYMYMCHVNGMVLSVTS